MKKLYIIISTIVISISGCTKYLDVKSDRKLTTPTTISDFQALLNDANYMNGYYCSSGEISTDDYYITDADYNTLNYDGDKRLYTWENNYVSRPQNLAGDDWYYCYRAIYVSNSVLKDISDLNLQGSAADNIRGQAYFFRASRYLDGAQIWAHAYNINTASSDMGMVLRTDPDMNIKSVRSSIKQTYDLIVNDLKNAINLLPTAQPGISLPDKCAAWGLLARTYLYMGDYENSLNAAEQSLKLNNQLLNFNNLNASSRYPIPVIKLSSIELLHNNGIYPSQQLNPTFSKISTTLYNLYDENDLRKIIYYQKNNNNNSYFFKGTHTGNINLISTVTTSEMYLIASECNIRLGNLSLAANYLNNLLIKRYKAGYFIPFIFVDTNTALETLINERRKELVMRGIRWSDLKRLNRDGANITLTRIVNNAKHTLEPNDNRYAIAIPEEVIELSGITQNPR